MAVAAFAVGLAVSVKADDWHQWRGPERNGIAAESAALVDEFPEGGPKEVWRSEEIRGYEQGGYGSVVVAAGKAYVYSNWKYDVSIPTRTLSANGLERLGGVADMPSDLSAKVEEARLSEELGGLEGRELRNWVGEWVRANVPEELRRFQGACQNRLLAGDKALPLEVLRKLDTIKDREFPDGAALDRWFNDNAIEEAWRPEVLRVIPTTEKQACDRVYCLNATPGETVWLFDRPGRVYGHSCSSTPCVVDGRCYVEGSDGRVYCLDAESGTPIWEQRSRANRATTQASSFVVIDGVAVLLAGPLTGCDVETGEILWTQRRVSGDYASAAYWHTGGKTFLMCNGTKETFCFDPRTGDILWSVPGGGPSTPAIVGDRMAVYSNNARPGLVAYRLSADGPEELWRFAIKDRGTSPAIHDGYVYAIGGRGEAYVRCVNLESGEVAWEQKLGTTEFSSPVVTDGKLLIVVGQSLAMMEASPEEYRLLGMKKLGIVPCTSAALVDGMVYLRLNSSHGCVACYDLKAQ